MSNILIINAHQSSAFSEGKLNQSLVERAEAYLSAQGHNVQKSASEHDYDIAEELEKHVWADVVIVQSPVNWMGVPWSFKKYMDEVYTAGMGGGLCNGDGRTTEEPKKNYGSGGTAAGKKYMLSLTFNAPKEAFDNPDEYLFQGKSVDDLWLPMHMNFRFFAMEGLPTFVAYDVKKNPEIESDFARFDAHLAAQFAADADIQAKSA